MHSGRWVTVVIFVMGLIAALAAWSHRYQQGRRSLEFWGPDAAYQIRFAPTVTLLRLARPDSPVAEQLGSPAAAAGESQQHLQIDGKAYPIAAQFDLTTARGLTHAREALIQDQSFDWQTEPDEKLAAWEYAVVFQQSGQRSTVLLDLTHDLVRPLDSSLSRRLTIASGMRQFFGDAVDAQVAE